MGNYSVDRGRWDRPENFMDKRPVYYVPTKNGALVFLLLCLAAAHGLRSVAASMKLQAGLFCEGSPLATISNLRDGNFHRPGFVSHVLLAKALCLQILCGAPQARQTWAGR